MFKKFVVAYDHNADEKYIKKIKEVLSENQIEIKVLVDDGKANDYPLLAKKCYEIFLSENADGMILLCGTGIGMNIVANKFGGLRAVLANCEEQAYFARRHENANVLVFGAGYSDGIKSIKLCRSKMQRMIETFINTPFQSEERHIRRVNQISDIEKGN